MKVSVTFYPEDIYSPLYRMSKRLLPKFAVHIKDKYVKKILNSISVDMYDIVFVIRGGILSVATLEHLKQKLPHAKFVMYQWDSMKQNRYESIMTYFDVIKTFDKQDSIQYKLDYLPLFYTSKYSDIVKNKKNKKYDLVFYGAYHSDRLEIIKYMENFCKQNDLIFKSHLYITKMALFRLLMTGAIGLDGLKYLKTYSIDTKEILEVYRETFAVLDIELNIQNGLTIRTFEALGAGLKLITTNKSIIDEPFYNDKNIFVLDRNSLNMDMVFFQNNFYFDTNFDNYLFENWLNNLINADGKKDE
ncbi:hypothetical protein KKA17_11205 [bacterium]|nr:hypothetical protein [bacterium]MBU1883796.1 hypothetical protein [bacterium]